MLARLQNYRFDWKLSLFTLLLFPVLISLGFWQLSREQEKLALQSLYEIRQNTHAQDLVSLNTADDLQYMPVSFRGSYDNEHSFLLDNKTYQGRAGFEVLSPFYTDQGDLLIINRGWIAQNAYRDILPGIDEVNGTVEVRGAVYVPVGEQFMLGAEESNDSWPRIIQSLNPEYMFSVLGRTTDIFPYSVRLAAFQPGVYVRNWPVISTTPEKHRGYAVQWFTMAAVLLFLYAFVSTRSETAIGKNGE